MHTSNPFPIHDLRRWAVWLRSHYSARVGHGLRSLPWLATVNGWVLLIRSVLSADRKTTLELRALAVRRFALGGSFVRVRSSLARELSDASGEHRQLEVGWTNYARNAEEYEKHTTVTTSLILKWPTALEAGVLYLSFEYNWLRILRSRDAKRLLQDFYIVGASSWSPPDYALLASFGASSPHPLFYGISNEADVGYLSGLERCAIPVPTLASDWNDPARFTEPHGTERDIDIIMVAHWGTFKQHWILFRALARLPKTLRVVLVGRPADGRDEHSLRYEARMMGVEQSLEIYTDIPSSSVRALLRRAKLSVLLSTREGSCVAVTESLYADTPVIMLRHAHVGSKKYISATTGLLTDAPSLSEAIRNVLDGECSFTPRETILPLSNCVKSTQALNSILREYAGSRSLPWTQDIATFCWDYMPKYVGHYDRELTQRRYESLEREYGIRIVGWD